jgi:predicted ATPase
MKLSIQNFKCFTKRDIPFRNLTILAGANGNGKSTCIQALLFLRQTIEQLGYITFDSSAIKVDLKQQFSNKQNLGIDIPLNDKFCLALGNSTFILNKNSRHSIGIGFSRDQDSEIFVGFDSDSFDASLSLKALSVAIGGKMQDADLPIFRKQFYYLNAERIGPRVRQGIQHLDFPHAGWQGEFTAQLLNRGNGYWKISEDKKYDGSPIPFLQDQVNLWLDFVIPGTRVKAVTDTNTLSAQILLENSLTLSEPTIAPNLGFGISYVLPIIVSGLVAEKGTFLIVENPESHLHPAAQSRIGQFLAMIANAGVYVVVETHSDHVINGIQIAVAKHWLANESVMVNFFNQENNESQPSVKPITLSYSGELSEWPKGFFDQSQIDFAKLIAARKHE